MMTVIFWGHLLVLPYKPFARVVVQKRVIRRSVGEVWMASCMGAPVKVVDQLSLKMGVVIMGRPA